MDLCNILFEQTEKKRKLENITMNAKQFSDIFDNLQNTWGPDVPEQFRDIKRQMVIKFEKFKDSK